MKRILIIEDDSLTSYIINDLLEANGYSRNQITRCSCIGEIKDINSQEIEIVITDLTLPDSVFPGTVEKVIEKFPNAPVIVLTSTSDAEIAVKAIECGAHDYLLKGEINQKILGKAMQYAISRKRIANDYKRLFYDSPSIMYIYDVDTFRFLAVNDAALIQYGYTREEFLKMSAEDIRPKDSLKSFYNINRLMSDDYIDAGLWRHLKKNSEEFFVHIYTHNTYFEGKNARVVQAIDVDKNVKTEIAFQEKVEEIEIILESITDGFLMLDNEWRFIYANKESEKAFNNDRANLIGRHIGDILPGIKEMKFYSECKRAVSEKIKVQFEEFYAPYNKWLLMNAYPSKEGLAIYFADITEKKNAHRKIIIEKQNLRATINNTKDIIWSINTNFEIMSANDAFWERLYLLTGKRKKEINESDFKKELFDTWISHYEKAFKGEAYKIVWTETNLGKTIYEEVSFNPIHDKDKNVIGVSCFSRDITEQKNHLNMIEKQNEQLRKIAWVQSHEVRGPVANILGLAQLFNLKDTSDPFNAEILNGIVLSTQKLDAIIMKINSYTEISLK